MKTTDIQFPFLVFHRQLETLLGAATIIIEVNITEEYSMSMTNIFHIPKYIHFTTRGIKVIRYH